MAAIGRTSLVGGGRQAHLRQSQQQGLGWLSSAVSRAKSSRCPNAYAFYVVSLSSHRAVLLPCGSWACVHCGRKKKEAARLMIEDGIARARARGHRVRFITLTSPSRQGLTMRELYVAFNRLRTKLRRSGHLREYFAVVETTQAGALHLHVLATGRYLPQRELSKAAAAARFGRVADIRAVTGTGDGSAGAYLVKTLAGYATKANAARLATRGARRLRPVRTSRAWYPGGMAEAEREVGRRMAAELSLAPDPGPWLFVVKGGDGALHVRSQAAPLVLLTTGAGVAQPSGGAATAPGGRGRAASAGRRPARGPGASGARP